jgi:hypothetical protein
LRRSLSLRARKKRGTGRRRIFAFALLVVVGLVSLGLIVTHNETPPATQRRAVIVDGLLRYPNPVFVEEATSVLDASGFLVDYVGVEEVTVDFYRRLPSLGYDIVILRVHCGPLVSTAPNGTKVAGQDAVMFTAELYDPNKYVLDQADGFLAKARIVNIPDEQYFAVPPWFITQRMEGEFRDTLIILDSCYGCYSMSMAQAFVSRGSGAFIGWEGEVGANHTDTAVLTILKGLCVEGLMVKNAVQEAMAEVGPDPYSGSTMLFYPSDRGDYVLSVEHVQ